MQDVFITKIHIDKVRHLQDIDIELSDNERKHLIITGKNGSGKTSLLERMKFLIGFRQAGGDAFLLNSCPIFQITSVEGDYISFSQGVTRNAAFAYISTKRNKPKLPTAIAPVKNIEKNSIMENASLIFFDYILYWDYQRTCAKVDNDIELSEILDKWFDNFEKALRDIYDCHQLELKRDRKNLAFLVMLPDHEPFGLHEMSDGYAALLDIYMELLMRFDEDGIVNYDHPAIILIDEIETHLHVELQKRVLPFLTTMFPDVQFIVTTHSPLVITSIDNAVVYDLEKQERLENPKFYSYQTIMESFLDTDMYSDEIKRDLKRYEELCFKERTPEENEEFLKAKFELETKSLPSTELYIAFQNIEARRRRAAKNGSSNKKSPAA